MKYNLFFFYILPIVFVVSLPGVRETWISFIYIKVLKKRNSIIKVRRMRGMEEGKGRVKEANDGR